MCNIGNCLIFCLGSKGTRSIELLHMDHGLHNYHAISYLHIYTELIPVKFTHALFFSEVCF
jgi:hypothetical protein